MNIFKRYFGALLISFIGTLLSFQLYLYEQKEEVAAKETYLKQHVLERKQAVENELNNICSLLTLFKQDWELSKDDFDKLAAPSIDAHSGILNLCWVKNIPNSEELGQLQNKLSEQGVVDFRIKELNEEGTFIESKTDSSTYCAIYSYPGAVQENSIVGFNLASKESNLKAFNEVVQTRELTLTTCDLNINNSTLHGLLAVYPIFNLSNHSKLEAFLVARLDINKIIQTSLVNFQNDDFHLDIYDVSAFKEIDHLGQYTSGDIENREEELYHYSFNVNIRNKQLRFDFKALDNHVLDEDSYTFLVFGLSITLFVVIYFVFHIYRTLKIQKLKDELETKIIENKHIEHGLIQSEKRFRILYENAPLSYQSLNAEGAILDVNTTWLQVMGYNKKDEVVGKSFGSFMTEASHQKFLKQFGEFKKVGSVNNAEFSLIKKTGETIMIYLNGNVHYTETGEFLHTHCIFSDISRQKEAERLIRQSEEKFRNYFQSSKAAMLTLDVQTKDIVDANTAALKFYGYTKNEILNLKIYDINTLAKDAIDSKMKQAMKSDSNYYIFQHKLANGSVKDVEVYNSLFTDNGHKLMTLIVHDITARTAAENQLQESEIRYKTAFVTSPDAIKIETLDGKYVDMNHGFASMFGFSYDEMKNQSVKDLKLWCKSEQREYLLKVLKEKGIYRNYEAQYRCKDGSIIDGLTSASIIYLNEEPHVLTITRDISKQKQHDKLLLDTVIETQEAERKKFAEDLHDELGPFLSGIKLYIQELGYDNIENEKRQSLVKYLSDFVNTAVEKTRSISNDLMPNVLVSYGLEAALKSFCLGITKASNISVNLSVDECKMMNKKVELALYRVISELINNSIKHAFPKNISIILKNEDDKISCLFSDDGVGFDFDQAIIDNKGIGLRSVIGRLSSINGHYKVSSEIGKGFKFDFWVEIMNT